MLTKFFLNKLINFFGGYSISFFLGISTFSIGKYCSRTYQWKAAAHEPSRLYQQAVPNRRLGGGQGRDNATWLPAGWLEERRDKIK